MSRIVIDTNILYSLIGLSVNQKVINSKIEDHKLSITTSSLVEAIVKHRNDISLIKKCINPIINEDIELISIGHTPLSNEYLMMLYLAETIDDVSNIINDITNMKISREAEFYRFILIIVVSGLFEVVREDGYKFDSEVKNQEQLRYVKSLFEPNTDLLLDLFKDEIRKGYDNGNEQQAALDTFQFSIRQLLKIFHFNYHMIKTNCYPNKASLDGCTILSQSLKDDDFDEKFKKYIDSPISYASRKKYFSVIDGYLKTMRNGISGLDGFTEKSLGFLLTKIESAYKNKSKIRKNDIFDFLIVISLNMPDTKIVTLDKGFLKDLKEIDPDSYQLCQKLGYGD